MPTPPLPEDQPSTTPPLETPSTQAVRSPVPCYFLSLELENVRAFKSRQKLSLTLPDGRPARWTVLLGDNGMGKTTVLECLAGMRLEDRIKNDSGRESRETLPWFFGDPPMDLSLQRVAEVSFLIEVSIGYCEQIADAAPPVDVIYER